MSDLYQTRLKQLKKPESYSFLTHILRGIEKEGLRVTSEATIAQTQHPQTLGSALTHSSITTDYSEALMEFITPAFQQIDDNIEYLCDLHSFTLGNIKDEYLWPASMPCRLAGDESIPIAQYGDSHIGKMKYVYRQGLAHRYGRTMQSIAGIHYNFSMPEAFWPYCQQISQDKGDLQAFKSQRYFDQIRNFRRHSWLLIYLFGASPALDKSFMHKEPHQLKQLSNNTLGLPFATSLRMSDLGYQSKAQASLNISYNTLDSYIKGIVQAIHQRHDDYEKIGVKPNGNYRQLNANILQIENEYYSEIRPKRVTHSGEKPVEALRKRGVEYVEVRILDTNPLLPVGIDAEQIRFLDAFMLYCLLSESPELSLKEYEEIQYNQQQVALEGRNPSLMLKKNDQPIAFALVAKKLLDDISPIADLFDQAHNAKYVDLSPKKQSSYAHALNAQRDKVADSELTPSGIIMQEIVKGNNFAESMLNQAKKHQDYFISRGVSDDINMGLKRLAKESFELQQAIEADDKNSFDDFLNHYNGSYSGESEPIWDAC